MLKKLESYIENVYRNVTNNIVICKKFKRNNQIIDTKSAYIGDKLFFRSWDIFDEEGRKIIKQTYNAGIPQRGGRVTIDIKV